MISQGFFFLRNLEVRLLMILAAMFRIWWEELTVQRGFALRNFRNLKARMRLMRVILLPTTNWNCRSGSKSPHEGLAITLNIIVGIHIIDTTDANRAIHSAVMTIHKRINITGRSRRAARHIKVSIRSLRSPAKYPICSLISFKYSIVSPLGFFVGKGRSVILKHFIILQKETFVNT